MKKKFTVECEMEESWIQPFVSMLKRMEGDGQVGHSEVVGLYADGDGNFRPFDYKVDGKELPRSAHYWERHDQEWPPRTSYPSQEPPPPYKTWRGVDFFFDAG